MLAMPAAFCRLGAPKPSTGPSIAQDSTHLCKAVTLHCAGRSSPALMQQLAKHQKPGLPLGRWCSAPVVLGRCALVCCSCYPAADAPRWHLNADSYAGRTCPGHGARQGCMLSRARPTRLRQSLLEPRQTCSNGSCCTASFTATAWTRCWGLQPPCRHDYVTEGRHTYLDIAWTSPDIARTF